MPRVTKSELIDKAKQYAWEKPLALPTPSELWTMFADVYASMAELAGRDETDIVAVARHNMKIEALEAMRKIEHERGYGIHGAYYDAVSKLKEWKD